MSRQQSKRKRRQPRRARASTCLNPDKERLPLWVARKIAARQGGDVYLCGDHYHVTHRSWGRG